ncbi:MAG: class I SAM-dependent methyltransferase, partial [bacterium]|nr:class I SAM-dependent methyltransferase [bacterium]
MQTLKLKQLLLQLYPDHPEEIKYFKQHFYRYLKTIKLIPPEYLRGKTVVDAGCIPGHMTSALKSLGAKEVTGLDYDPERFDFQQKLQNRGPKIIKCHLGQEPIPLPADYADCVIFTEVIEHLSDNPILVLKELRRVLKPGGRLI